MKTTYTLNTEHNRVEISFSEKPGDIIRDELKKLGFRWHKVKKVWYAKQSADTVELAERLASREDNAAELTADSAAAARDHFEQVTAAVPSAKFIDGGGLYDGWEGGKRAEWHSEQELKALIAADFKKAGIYATIRFGRGGYLTRMIVTIKINA